MKFRAVLVEDEEHSLSRLRRLLSRSPQDIDIDIEVVGEAVDGPSAVAAIRAHAPDIVFLDIELPGFNGFRVLEGLGNQPFVIFTTAYNQHALEAFRAHAIDYLLKPIDAEALGKALTKLRKMTSQGIKDNRFDLIMKLLAPPYLERLQCKERDRKVVVKLGEVLYFQADRGYTAVHTANREYLHDSSLADLEKQLNPKDFTRIHRSTLVNVSWIAEIRGSYDGRVVRLNDAKGTELAVSRMFASNLDDI